MRISTAAAVALTVLLAMASFGAVAAMPPADRSPSASSHSFQSDERPPSVSSTQESPPPLESPEPGQVVRVRITDDGDARWSVETRFLITNETEADLFREYGGAIVSGRRAAPYDPRLFQRYAADASESTGREMSIENAGWDDQRIERAETDAESESGSDARIGIVSYSFTWTNFAEIDGDRMYAGDTVPVIGTLSEDQRLVVDPPENYGFVDAPTGTDDGALVWDGPHTFRSEGLEITMLRGAGAGGGDPPLLSGTGWLLVALVALLVGVSGYLVVRRDDVHVPRSPDRLAALVESVDVSNPFDRDKSDVAATDGNGGTDPASPTAATDDPDAEPDTHLEYDERSSDDAVDPELLSDEERVLRLLKQNGGRMKQASIVSETGWSNAKVSQLLSQMDDDDEIDKLRIGRENLITLPGVDPTELD
ncbi:hypothetical protein A6E15_00745 [Natrinema saccharevitans]|uniref:HTH iclR-type domain-containing protein n=1 Tax=Natrinema saccharevitans TaxID=301967 RepID=A0A1S8ASV8_9EURY|nr:hypothetical protein [Natrinema saccharevitans]OLZ39599.1 hypothetical protein A6E15_00745 [Natrinema saccharevitans]